jgi:hypothetical protein
MRTERDQDRPSKPASKAEKGKRTPIARTRSAPRAPSKQNEPQVTAAGAYIGIKGTLKTRPSDTQNEPEAAAAIEALKSEAAAAIEAFKSEEAAVIEALSLQFTPITGEGGLAKSILIAPGAAEHYEVAADVDAILKRLDQGIAAEHAAIDRLLERIVSRTPR